jgi:hypothetical protein
MKFSITNKTASATTIATWLVLLCLLIAASTTQASVDIYLDGQIKLVESRINSWQSTSRTIEWLTYAVVAIGVIVAALQAWKNNWVKAGAATLAVVSALIVGFTHTFFPADDRAYQKVARQARSKLQAFSLELEQYTILDQQTRKGLYEKFGKLQQALDDFETNAIYGGAAASTNVVGFGFDVLFATTVRADQQGDSVRIPQWAQKVPTDERNIYFLGVADGASFEQARSNSLNKARESAADAVTKAAQASPSLAGQPQFIEKLAKALAGFAEIAETFTAPIPEGAYRSFTLLRISKSAATFTAQSVFVESSVPYDKAFLDKVRTNFKR